MNDPIQYTLEDKILIRDRYSLYSDAVFQADKDKWLACWSDAGAWFVFGKEVKGKAALSAQWDATWNTIDKMAFFSEIGDISISTDMASVRSYCREVVAFTNGTVLKVVAKYDDELIKKDGNWLFSKRKYTVLIKE